MNEPRAEISGKEPFFWPAVGLAFLLGSALRLYLLPDQILVNDEWHGMSFVAGKSWRHLLVHYNWRAISIPMNLYRLSLLNTVGWSETLMRIPSLAAGLACLVVLPALVRRTFGSSVAAIAAFLFAVSPFLVYYSRLCRAYGVIVLLAAVAFFSLLFWSETGKRTHAALYVACGAGALVFHPTPAVTVLAPLGLLFLLKIFGRNRFVAGASARIVPRASEIVVVGVVLVTLWLTLVVPGFLQDKLWLKVSPDPARVTLHTLAGFASLTSGTANRPLSLLFWCFFVAGQIAMLRRRTIVGIASLSVVLLYLVGLSAAEWETIDLPLEFTRFCISLFPIILSSVALGIDSIAGPFAVRTGLRTLPRIPASIPVSALFLGGLLAASPLVSTYKAPNNFTNHSAFNESYEPLEWDRSYASGILPDVRMRKEDIPRFYDELASRKDVEAIVEYPMFLGDHFNLYYYYQHVHGKTVVVGYVSGVGLDNWPFGDHVFGNMFADFVLSRVARPEAYRFRNMVDMWNIAALKASPASYVILHKDPYREMFPWKRTLPPGLYDPVLSLRSAYVGAFGPPELEDSVLVVFRIRPR